MERSETHGPSGQPHPQYILDYIAAFKDANPNSSVPAIWACGNGWLTLAGRQRRPSQIVAMTKVLRERMA